MNTLRIFYLTAFATGLIFFLSCKLERVEPSCPKITNLTPTAAQGGDTITITGENFLVGLPHLYKVTVGDQTIDAGNIEVISSTTLRFKVPVGIGSGPVSLRLASGIICNSANTLNFIYQLKVTGIDVFAKDSFNLPAGMAVDPISSNLIIADKNNHIIREVTSLGKISTIAGKKGLRGQDDNDNGANVKFYAPEDVAVDPQGNIYVADDYNSCIRLIENRTGRPVSTVVGKIGEAGNTDDNTIRNSRLNRPTGVALKDSKEAKASMFTVENSIYRLRYIDFNLGNINTLAYGINSLKFPTRVAYSEKRNTQYPIFVTDYGNNRILEMNANGTARSPIISFPSPQDLEVDEFGDIIALNNARKVVSVIYRDNTIKDIFGAGINYNSFQAPSGLAIDTKNHWIYISDATANNILKVKYQ